MLIKKDKRHQEFRFHRNTLQYLLQQRFHKYFFHIMYQIQYMDSFSKISYPYNFSMN